VREHVLPAVLVRTHGEHVAAVHSR
jgi:hypothetical protein